MSDRLVFRLSEKYYGIDTNRVYGIIEAEDIYFLPGRSGFIRGVISLHGETVTVLDSAVLSDQPCAENEYPGKIIVMKIEDQFLGLDISGAKVFFLWGKKSGARKADGDNPGHGLETPPLTEPIEDVPCETILSLAEKILAPGRRKVLIADDMVFYRTAVKEALTSGGFDVVAEACDGEEAITLAKKHRPEIVILDMVMPKKNGIEATGEIKILSHAPRIVICSSLRDDGIIREAKEAGADAYVTKPFTSLELLRTVLNLS